MQTNSLRSFFKGVRTIGLALTVAFSFSCEADNSQPIFDGKTFEGWEGDFEWFYIQQKSVVAGSLGRPIQENQFLCTKQEYADFILSAKFRVVGAETNGGIQFRSERHEGSSEVIGYQADIGQVFTGSIYDESRRNAFLSRSSNEVMEKIRPSHPEDFSDYVITAQGDNILLIINGHETSTYTEIDPNIPRSGKICLQIHSGPEGEIWYKDIRVEELSAK